MPLQHGVIRVKVIGIKLANFIRIRKRWMELVRM
jgi:hypothetical protein